MNTNKHLVLEHHTSSWMAADSTAQGVSEESETEADPVSDATRCVGRSHSLSPTHGCLARHKLVLKERVRVVRQHFTPCLLVAQGGQEDRVAVPWLA